MHVEIHPHARFVHVDGSLALRRAASCGILQHVVEKTTQHTARHRIQCEQNVSRTTAERFQLTQNVTWLSAITETCCTHELNNM